MTERQYSHTEVQAIRTAALREAAKAAFNAGKATNADYADENSRLLQRAESEMRLSVQTAILALIDQPAEAHAALEQQPTG